MTTLVEDIQAVLAAVPGVTGGIFYGANTAEPPTFPYIVWMRVSSSPNVTLAGPSDLQNTRVQIDIVSRSVKEATTLETALEAAMAAAGLTNVPISSMDLYEDAIRAYRIVKDYSIWARN